MLIEGWGRYAVSLWAAECHTSSFAPYSQPVRGNFQNTGHFCKAANNQHWRGKKLLSSAVPAGSPGVVHLAQCGTI